MEKYKYTDLSGSMTLKVYPNSAVEDNDVFIEVTNGRRECGYINVSGVDDIKELIYAIAVHGGLLNEGGDLFLQPARKLPKDGTYLLSTETKNAMVVVEDGKLYIPQTVVPNGSATGYLMDSTQYYVRAKSTWTLTEMKKG